MITIRLIDDSPERYTQKADTYCLGRMYDHIAEELKVIKPKGEENNVCVMIVKANGKVIDHIIIGNEPIKVTSNLSQYEGVTIGFSFSNATGYIKNAEPKNYYFAHAEKPSDFVPMPPEQWTNVDLIVGSSFTRAVIEDNFMVFYNLNDEELSRVDLNVDLTNYVALDTNQTITGLKSINYNGDNGQFRFDADPEEPVLIIKDSGGDGFSFSSSYGWLMLNPTTGFQITGTHTDFYTGLTGDTPTSRMGATSKTNSSVKSELKVVPEGAFYNDKEIATKDDLVLKDVVEPSYKTGVNNDIVKSNVVKLKGYSLSTPRYYKLCEFIPSNDQNNYSSVSIEGRMGDWVSNGMAQWEILFSNRNGYSSLSSVLSFSSNSGLTQCDLVVYEQEDKSCVMYLKCFKYYTTNFEIITTNCTNVYDGEFTIEEPAGTLVWTLGTSDFIRLNTYNTLKSDVDTLKKQVTELLALQNN